MKPAMVNVLLLEDNPGDAELVRLAVENERGVSLHVLEDGASGEDFLMKRGAHAAAVRPDLILLDLNLPRKSGREVLKLVKGDQALASIPVVVVSGMQGADDIVDAYSLHANCFITKPDSLEDALNLLKSVLRYWVHTVRLPLPAPEHAVVINAINN